MPPQVDPFTRLARSAVGRRLALVLLLLGALLAATSAARKSVTIDEFAYLPNGVALLEYGAYHIDRGVPPLPKLLFALPVVLFTDAHLDGSDVASTDSGWKCGEHFLSKNRARYHGYFAWGRAVSLLVLFATGYLTYRFARSLYGDGGGLVAAAFVSLSPNLIAHGRLTTTDIYLTAAVVASLWAFDGFLRRPGWRSALLLGVAVGTAAT